MARFAVAPPDSVRRMASLFVPRKSTTTATLVVQATPSAITTVFKVEMDGTIEEPSNASSPVVNIVAQTANSSDAITVKRGSYCTLF